MYRDNQPMLSHILFLRPYDSSNIKSFQLSTSSFSPLCPSRNASHQSADMTHRAPYPRLLSRGIDPIFLGFTGSTVEFVFNPVIIGSFHTDLVIRYVKSI
jgi:hypothetical protein